MRATKLILRNIMGHEEYEIDLDRNFTLVEGLNGQGKTSAIEAIRNLAGGGNDATLLRNGATEGETVLLLDDSTELRKRLYRDKSPKVTVTRDDVGQINAAQTYIRRILDNVDPTAMLAERDEAKRTQFLLEALPLELPKDELQAAIAGLLEHVSDADLVGHPLQVVDKMAKRVYEARRDVNRDANAKKVSIEQLSKSIVDVGGEDPTKEANDLEQERADLAERFHTDSATIRDEANKRGEAVRGNFDEQISEKRRQIAALEAEVLRLNTEKRDRVSQITEEGAREIERIRTEGSVRNAEIRGRLEQLRQGIEARSAVENTRSVVAGFQAEFKTLTEKSAALSAALERIESIKAGLLKSVPLKGVTIEDGVIHENGVPWPRINTGNRVKMAINLAKLRAKELPLVPIDNIEMLDGPTFEAFRKNAPKSGLQFIVTRVRQAADDKRPGLEVSGRGTE